MRVFIKAYGWLYEHWGTMSQLIVGVFAFVLSIRPKTVAALEEDPELRIGLPILVGVIFVTGYMVSESSDANLKAQLATMYQQVRLEATKDDISSLSTHIDNGFKSVVDAIASLCKAAKPTTIPQHAATQPPLPVPPNVSITQARAVSTDPQFRFALQVTIQSNQQIPASFVFECSGDVGKVDAFLVGHSAMMEVLLGRGQNPNEAIVHFGYPPLSPQSPLIVTILSKEDIRVQSVRPY